MASPKMRFFWLIVLGNPLGVVSRIRKRDGPSQLRLEERRFWYFLRQGAGGLSEPDVMSMTDAPTSEPSFAPTASPSASPSEVPTASPSASPTGVPSSSPSAQPTSSPSGAPTAAPSDSPTSAPSQTPTTVPTASPSLSPTSAPSQTPSAEPTTSPSGSPSSSPSSSPTSSPSESPTDSPSVAPSSSPTSSPTQTPSETPSTAPTRSSSPSSLPTATPTLSIAPSTSPTIFCEDECRFITGSLTGNAGLMDGRIRRNETTSTCENGKDFPSVFGSVIRHFETIGPFCNRRPEDVCAQVSWDFGTCEDSGDVQVHPVAYTSFDPENQAEGYLGDSGPSSTADFSFVLPGNTNFFMIFQQVFPGADGIGCTFGFRIDFGFCGLPADTDPPPFDPIGSDNNGAYGDNTDRFLDNEF